MLDSIRTYLVMAFGLLLIAGPWLQHNAAEAVTVDHEDCTCCAAVVTPCCCPMAGPEADGPKSESDDCPCHLAALPDMPDQPMEALVERVDTKSAGTDKEALSSAPIHDTGSPRVIRDHSPPASGVIPAYILHSAFLI